MFVTVMAMEALSVVEAAVADSPPLPFVPTVIKSTMVFMTGLVGGGGAMVVAIARDGRGAASLFATVCGVCVAQLSAAAWFCPSL